MRLFILLFNLFLNFSKLKIPSLTYEEVCAAKAALESIIVFLISFFIFQRPWANKFNYVLRDAISIAELINVLLSTS